jgi:hypothetical protein
VTTPQIFAQTKGLITVMAHEAEHKPKIESQSDLVFVEIVTGSETCHIYKAVLLTIKVAPVKHLGQATHSLSTA